LPSWLQPMVNEELNEDVLDDLNVEKQKTISPCI
jgi:hypothetical protein